MGISGHREGRGALEGRAGIQRAECTALVPDDGSGSGGVALALECQMVGSQCRRYGCCLGTSFWQWVGVGGSNPRPGMCQRFLRSELPLRS